MKTIIVSYSLTGNNTALAKSLKKQLEADHIEVKTKKKFTMGSLILDILFNRAPKVVSMPTELDDYENIIFMGPLWMGQAATPLRKYFAHIKNTQQNYSYVTVCGGAKGGNGKIEEQFLKRIGRAPDKIVELCTAKLVPEEAKEDIKATTDYKLSEDDVSMFTQKAIEALS